MTIEIFILFIECLAYIYMKKVDRRDKLKRCLQCLEGISQHIQGRKVDAHGGPSQNFSCRDAIGNFKMTMKFFI